MKRRYTMLSIRKYLSIILALLMLVSVFAVAPITANAEVSKSGTVGDCQYEFDSATGHLRIFGGTTIEKDGNGKMPWATDGPVSFNSLSVRSVTIENGIKTIGNGAFYWCKNLTSVTMPNDLTYIGKSAFSECTGLKTINLPFELETIDIAAFSNCTALESISFSTHIKLIGNEAFNRCTKLAEVTINDGAKAEIGKYAFRGTALEEVFIPAGTKKIGSEAFGYDSGDSPVTAFTIYTTEGSVVETYAKNKDHITVVYIKPITKVDFTDIVEPKIDSNPSFTYNTTTEGFSVKNAKPVWTNATDGETVSATKKFKNLKEYSVAFTLKADKGYKFAVDDKRKTTVKGTINGQDAIITAAQFTPEDEITVSLTFPKLYDPDNPVILYDVTLRNVEEPVAGAKPNTNVFTYGDGYSKYNGYWYNVTDKKRMTSSDVFKPLKEYKLVLFLQADIYHVFCVAEDTVQVSGTIDDIAVDTSKVTSLDPKKYICVTSKIYKTGEQELGTMAFTQINEPEVNDEAIFTFKATEGVTVENNAIEWWNDTDKEDMKNGDKFEEGKTYYAFFNVTAKDGYNFAVDKDNYTTVTAQINHKDAEVQQLPGENPVKKLRVYLKYPSLQKKTPLTSVAITNLAEPVAGAKVVKSVEAPTGVTVKSVNWYNLLDGAIKEGDTFKYNTEYTVMITLIPATGYTFKGVTPEVTINGKKAHISQHLYEDYLTADVKFETEPNPTEPDTTYSPSEPTESQPDTLETTPDPEETTSPQQSTDPEETTSPQQSTDPEETTSPQQSTDPEVTTSPQQSTDPEVTTSPQQSTDPEATTSPQQSTDPEAPTNSEPATSPEGTTAPTQPAAPETTTAPDQPTSPTVTKKAANPIKVTAKTKSVKLKKLRKKAQKVKVLTIKNAKGKVSVKITKAKKIIKKFLKISTKGNLTIRTWKKAKKGNYKIKVQIKAKGNSKYKSKTINKTIKLRIK